MDGFLDPKWDNERTRKLVGGVTGNHERNRKRTASPSGRTVKGGGCERPGPVGRRNYERDFSAHGRLKAELRTRNADCKAELRTGLQCA